MNGGAWPATRFPALGDLSATGGPTAALGTRVMATRPWSGLPPQGEMTVTGPAAVVMDAGAMAPTPRGRALTMGAERPWRRRAATASRDRGAP